MTVAELIAFASQTVAELYITANADKDTRLPALNSPSSVAIYKAWLYVFAQLAYFQRQTWEGFEAYLRDAALRAQPGNTAWLAEQIRQFQFGNTLVWDAQNKKYYYPDQSGQPIVERFAIRQAPRQTTVLVVKQGATALEEFSSAELDAFKAYLNRIQFAGTNIVARSFNPDQVRVTYRIFYDASLRTPAEIAAEVDSAVNRYLTRQSYTRFDGYIYASGLQDVIQDYLTGENEDVVIAYFAGRVSGGTYKTVNRIYEPVAGFAVHDPAAAPSDLMILETI